MQLAGKAWARFKVTGRAATKYVEQNTDTTGATHAVENGKLCGERAGGKPNRRADFQVRSPIEHPSAWPPASADSTIPNGAGKVTARHGLRA